MYTWAVISAKAALLLTLWLGAVPLLVGLLFELLVVIPLRVPVDESPVFLLYQDWALGLLFLKIWTRLVMVGQGPFANEAWKAKFEQVSGTRLVSSLYSAEFLPSGARLSRSEVQSLSALEGCVSIALMGCVSLCVL